MPAGGRLTTIRFALLLGFLLLGASPARAGHGPDDPLRPPEAGWDREHRGERFSIYSRKVPGSRFREHLLVGLLDASPEACFRVATDYPAYPDFMPYCRFARVIERREGPPGRTELTLFLYLDIPVLSDRYVTSRYVDEEDVIRQGRPGCYVSTWESVLSGPRHRTPASPDLREALPRAGGVEVAGDRGSWLFEPLARGPGTRMVYREWSDPGGRIPAWVNNMGGETSLKSLWQRFQERVAAESR